MKSEKDKLIGYYKNYIESEGGYEIKCETFNIYEDDYSISFRYMKNDKICVMNILHNINSEPHIIELIEYKKDI